mmetsp:Transcript_42652/g.135504  ORF Transcript_42652/g.135504 Transcript_42652/m.135504 type:complete len:427 (+) Transcript_42652:1460-2740(+)
MRGETECAASRQATSRPGSRSRCPPRAHPALTIPAGLGPKGRAGRARAARAARTPSAGPANPSARWARTPRPGEARRPMARGRRRPKRAAARKAWPRGPSSPRPEEARRPRGKAPGGASMAGLATTSRASASAGSGAKGAQCAQKAEARVGDWARAGTRRPAPSGAARRRASQRRKIGMRPSLGTRQSSRAVARARLTLGRSPASQLPMCGRTPARGGGRRRRQPATPLASASVQTAWSRGRGLHRSRLWHPRQRCHRSHRQFLAPPPEPPSQGQAARAQPWPGCHPQIRGEADGLEARGPEVPTTAAAARTITGSAEAEPAGTSAAGAPTGPGRHTRPAARALARDMAGPRAVARTAVLAVEEAAAAVACSRVTGERAPGLAARAAVGITLAEGQVPAAETGTGTATPKVAAGAMIGTGGADKAP